MKAAVLLLGSVYAISLATLVVWALREALREWRAGGCVRAAERVVRRAARDERTRVAR